MFAAPVAASSLADAIDAAADAIESTVIAWRRDIHANPELGNREFRTAALVAEHLQRLGLDEVRTGVAHTGVVGLLKGALPGPVVALRADMDALPVAEEVDVTFASKAKAQWNGESVGVMHACGHDAHVAILMGVAEVLVGLRGQLRGSVKFIFQPAEELPPEGEEGGAQLMIEEGALGDPQPDAIFGLHVGITAADAGTLTYRANGFMAASDFFKIVVHGRQTHGATPWDGVDPVVTAAAIVNGLQTIVSRQAKLVVGPAVVTVGAINAGVRNNIIPDSTVMLGTVRTFDPAMRDDIGERIKRTAELIAQSQGATATVEIQRMTPVTANDASLTARMAPTLRRVAGAGNVIEGQPVTGAEDFGYFAEQVPAMFVFLGVRPKGSPLSAFVSNHSPKFFADEAALPTGVKTLVALATDFLAPPTP